MSGQIIFVRDGLVRSLVRDTYSVVTLAGLMWFNANYCGGSGWIYFAVSLVWFLWILSRSIQASNQSRMTPAQIRVWLDEHHPIRKREAA